MHLQKGCQRSLCDMGSDERRHRQMGGSRLGAPGGGAVERQQNRAGMGAGVP